MPNFRRLTLLALFLQAALPSLASADGLLSSLLHKPTQAAQSIPASPEIEVGFSPAAGAEALVIKVIQSARESIHVLAYSFTSKPIAQALLDAHKRGVAVTVVVDKSQKTEKYTSATFLANVGIPVRVDSQHAIQHNKVLVVDQKTVETGSFNFTAAAANRNAENALVIWNNPRLAQVYLADWKKHWDHAEPYGARY